MSRRKEFGIEYDRVHMSPTLFARTYKTHPLQGHTEERARKALKKHLKKPHVTHADVHAAVFEGMTYIVDGHTRSYLWATGKLEAPVLLNVTIYYPSTRAEFDLLYKTFDSAEASEANPDKVYGAMRNVGVDLKSYLVRTSISSAVLRARSLLGGSSARNDIYAIAAEFKQEIEMLDAIDPHKTIFRSGVMTAALVCLRLYPAEAAKFFAEVNASGGSADGKSADATYALREILRLTKSKGGGSGVIAADLSNAITCFDYFLRGKRVKFGLRGPISYDPLEPRAFIDNATVTASVKVGRRAAKSASVEVRP